MHHLAWGFQAPFADSEHCISEPFSLSLASYQWLPLRGSLIYSLPQPAADDLALLHTPGRPHAAAKNRICPELRHTNTLKHLSPLQIAESAAYTLGTKEEAVVSVQWIPNVTYCILKRVVRVTEGGLEGGVWCGFFFFHLTYYFYNTACYTNQMLALPCQKKAVYVTIKPGFLLLFFIYCYRSKQSQALPK